MPLGPDTQLVSRLILAQRQLVEVELGERHRDRLDISELRGLLVDVLVALHEPRMVKAHL